MLFKRGDCDEFESRGFARLVTAHAGEVGALGAKLALPSMRTYRQLEAAGSLVVFLAYEDDRAAGYQSFLVTDHPHYSGTRWAQCDALYLAHWARKGLAGVRFMQYADAALRDAGIRAVLRGTTTKLDISPLLRRMGYGVQEISYMKEF